jgi:hypothetical protein
MVRRNDVAVKIDANVIREAKMVAASRDLTLAEYLSDLLRPLVHKDLEAETGKRLAPPPGPSSEPPKKKGGGR